MRAREFIIEQKLNEIGFANQLDDNNFDHARIIKLSKVDGQIQGQDVMTVESGNQQVYFLVTDGSISAFIGFENGYLKNIKNFSGAKDIVRLLIGYLVHIKSKAIKISSNEPLTSDGLKWVLNLIKQPRGLKILDQCDNLIDSDSFRQEWNYAKTHGEFGPTSITITETSQFGETARLHEHRRSTSFLLMPMNFYDITPTKIKGTV